MTPFDATVGHSAIKNLLSILSLNLFYPLIVACLVSCITTASAQPESGLSQKESRSIAIHLHLDLRQRHVRSILTAVLLELPG